jgi:hypothetical protein
MATSQIDAVTELQNAFQALTKNWILALPTAVVSLLEAIFGILLLATALGGAVGAGALGAMHPGAALGMLAASGIWFALGIVVLVLLALLANAIVVGAAEHVWHGQPPDISGGISKAVARIPTLLALFGICVVLGCLCVILLPLLGLGALLGLAMAFFFMYAMPAIIVGNQGAVDALRSSYHLVRANIGPSVTAFIGIILVLALGRIVTLLFSHIPVVNIIVHFLVGGVTTAYAALVAVRFYDILRSPLSQTTSVPVTPTI